MANNTKQKKRKSTANTTRNRKQKHSLPSLSKRTRIILLICAVFFVAIAVIVGFSISNSNHHNMLALNKDVAMGIDVSHHNGNIDWHTVADNVDFAIVRVGYRGYSEGELNPDRKARRNLRSAQKAGVPLGVYFYSQAITTDEAEQEARYALKAIKGYDVELPVFIDVEYACVDSGHTGRLYDAHLSREDMTDIVNAFCAVIKDAGYTPGVYASTSFYNAQLDAKDITHSAVKWVADYHQHITYTGKYDIWQATDSGSCDGVPSRDVDIDYWYLKK